MSDAPHVSSDALTSKPLALRVMPMPADLNPSGDVFGGWAYHFCAQEAA